MAVHVIIVAPARRSNGVTSPGNYTATLQDEARPIALSRTPFLDAARALLARGFAGDDVLVMRWAGSAVDSLKAQLGVAARFAVQERNASSPSLRFAPYAPLPEKLFVTSEGLQKNRRSRCAEKGERRLAGRDADHHPKECGPDIRNRSRGCPTSARRS
jgi:hypothetical protein